MQEALKKTVTGNYRAGSVQKYVQELKGLYDHDFEEMRARLVALRDENRQLKEALDDYKEKERFISASVLKAEQLAQFIRDEAEFQAGRRIAEAGEAERRAKAQVEQYMEQLFSIQRCVSQLLNEVIETTAMFGNMKFKPESPAPRAAEVYQRINGISGIPAEDAGHACAV